TASTISDLPAPVSPVSTLKPSPKSMATSDRMAKLVTRRWRSMAVSVVPGEVRAAAVARPVGRGLDLLGRAIGARAPVQLLAQDVEVALLGVEHHQGPVRGRDLDV